MPKTQSRPRGRDNNAAQPNATRDKPDDVQTSAGAGQLPVNAGAKNSLEPRHGDGPFRAIFESAIEGIAIVVDDKPVLVNQSFCDIFGYTKKQVLAFDSTDRLIVPAGRARVQTFRERRLQGGPAPRRYEFEGIHKDGSRIWLEVSAYATQWQGAPAIQAALIDITERKEIEDHLRESEARHRNMIELAPDAIFINTAKEILFVNPAALRLLGDDQLGDDQLGDEQLGDERRGALLRRSSIDLLHPA